MSIHTPSGHLYQHGVLTAIKGKGLLITGAAGTGKSSLALELLSMGFQLIADDSIKIASINNRIIGSCPPLLERILHTRELGLISIPKVFGDQAWLSQHTIDYVVELQIQVNKDPDLTNKNEQFTILDKKLPFITLSTSSPASLSNRILCWLAMQAEQELIQNDFIYRQQQMMTSL